MRRILFDIISLQEYHNGGEEYVRTVLNVLLKCDNLEIIGLYDSKLSFLDDDYNNFSKNIRLLDIQQNNLSKIIDENKIETFFIGIGQRFNKYDLSSIKCHSLCVIHDIGNIEYSVNRINYLFPKSIKVLINILLDYLCPKSKFTLRSRINKEYSNIINFVGQSNVELVTVSNYTANSLKYYFPALMNKSINVLYPPRKGYQRKADYEDCDLREFVKNGKQFLLLLNIGRVNKNGLMIIDSFKRIKSEFPELQLIVTGAKRKVAEEDVLYLNYVSNSDVENLYKTAYALIYPSVTEGFGYPPIEALKYGTPVICANVCSMPEVLGKAALYFSPFYQNDFYQQIKTLLKGNKQHYYDMGIKHSERIAKRQIEDFDKLISMF